jgi:hypothetical protein
MTVVLTETLVKKLFGQDKAIGEIIKLNNSKELTVGAIIKEPEEVLGAAFTEKVRSDR